MMRARGILLVLVSLLIAMPITAWCQQANSTLGEVLTLEQAVALALRENHMVKNAGFEVAKAGPLEGTWETIVAHKKA